MSHYRRDYRGRIFFFTVVTYNRKGILVCEPGRSCLKEAFENVRAKYPFTIKAMCLLPDHIHCIMELPDDDRNYSLRWALIKRRFTKTYLNAGGKEASRTASMQRRGNRGVWQKRFWEHRIRDDEDLANHINYIHYNPVKHKLAEKPADWQWSTSRKYARQGWKGDSAMSDLYGDEGIEFVK